MDLNRKQVNYLPGGKGLLSCDIRRRMLFKLKKGSGEAGSGKEEKRTSGAR
jgi:hypothetical protein